MTPRSRRSSVLTISRPTVQRASWKAAQEHEMAWWTGLEAHLGSSESRERKRRAAMEIWHDIESIRPVPREVRVLEVGTGGDGWVNFLPSASCVGLDPLLLEMRRRGMGMFERSVRFVSGVGEALPFRSDSFEVAFSYNVLDHMAEPERGLTEIRRVMRSGGILHLLVDTYRLAFVLYRRFYRPDPYHPSTFTMARIRRMLRSRGFRVVLDVSDTTPQGRRRNLRCRVFAVLDKGPGKGPGKP